MDKSYPICVCETPDKHYFKSGVNSTGATCGKCGRYCGYMEGSMYVDNSPPDVETAPPKPKEEFNSVKDSGARQEFSTGAVRDRQAGKGMPHLLPTHALHRLAKHFENGARKYSKNNWRKGMPLSQYMDSCFRHWCSILDCDHSEDHAAALLWNAACFIETAHMIVEGKVPKELDDIGWLEEKDGNDTKSTENSIG